MRPLANPERVYDTRQTGNPMAAGEVRRVTIGGTQAFVHVTYLTTAYGWVSVSGTDTRSASSLVNADSDGVASSGAPISLPDGDLRVYCSAAGDIVVDVYAR